MKYVNAAKNKQAMTPVQKAAQAHFIEPMWLHKYISYPTRAQVRTNF